MTPRTLPFLALVLLAAGALVLLTPRPGRAADEKPSHTMYVSIQGEGTTAKAWYRGAAPTGVAVQEALDALSRDGYRVVGISPSSRPSTTIVTAPGGPSAPPLVDQTWVVLMEKR